MGEDRLNRLYVIEIKERVSKIFQEVFLQVLYCHKYLVYFLCFQAKFEVDSIIVD